MPWLTSSTTWSGSPWRVNGQPSIEVYGQPRLNGSGCPSPGRRALEDRSPRVVAALPQLEWSGARMRIARPWVEPAAARSRIGARAWSPCCAARPVSRQAAAAGMEPEARLHQRHAQGSDPGASTQPDGAIEEVVAAVAWTCRRASQRPGVSPFLPSAAGRPAVQMLSRAVAEAAAECAEQGQA